MPSIAYYSKVATEEGGAMESPKHSNGPLATPPMMKRPWVWGLFLVFAIGGGLLLTSGSSSATEVADPASQTIAPPPLNLRGSNAASPPPDTTEISALFEEVVLKNSQLRSQVQSIRFTTEYLCRRRRLRRLKQRAPSVDREYQMLPSPRSSTRTPNCANSALRCVKNNCTT